MDGTSLTICDVDAVASTFTFMLVAHTQQNVIIPNKAIGVCVFLALCVCFCVCVFVCAYLCIHFSMC